VSDFPYLLRKHKKPPKCKLCNFERRLISFIALLIVFNTLDEFFTLWGLRLQLIEEANPLMQQLIIHRPITLMTVKLLLPIILGYLMWYIRSTSPKLVSYGLGIVLTCYSGVMVLHGYWIINVLFAF